MVRPPHAKPPQSDQSDQSDQPSTPKSPAGRLHVQATKPQGRRNDRHKVLVLASRFPFPALSGGKLFLLHTVRALRECDVTLLSICATREEMEFQPTDSPFAAIHRVYLPRWHSILKVLAALPTRTPLQLAYYQSRAFRQKVAELLPQHDTVLAHLIRTGQYLEGQQEIPQILLMCDAISMAYNRMANKAGSSRLWHFLYRTELARLRPYEQACPQSFDQAWLHSAADRAYLGLDPETTRIIPMGIDLADFPFTPAVEGNVVAFVGNMSFSLNSDACFHFIRDIFPALRDRAGIRFRVIGACPPAMRKKLKKHAGVEVTGKVRKIGDGIKDAFCGVCSVRGGAGMQNKVLNYMALGLPCVTSHVGFEGIGAVPGRDLFVYHQPDDAVDLILKLHANPDLRRETAAHARRFIEGAYDWNILYRSIREEVAQLAAGDWVRTAVG